MLFFFLALNVRNGNTNMDNTLTCVFPVSPRLMIN